MVDGYTSRDVARLLSLTPAEVRRYVRAGFLDPARGPRRELRFSFQDLVLMRTARALLEASVPLRRVRSALRKLRQQLPAGRPLSAVAIAAEGNRIVVRDGRAVWHPESGQALFDFQVAEIERKVERMQGPARRKVPSGRSDLIDADSWYERGLGLEASAPARAREAYRRALAMAPRHRDALVNLGRLLHEDGDLSGAETHYRRALEVDAADATALFNLGVALEDQGKIEDAVPTYQRAISADGACADAHYNLARIFERLGRTAAAIRHLRAYRKLTE